MVAKNIWKVVSPVRKVWIFWSAPRGFLFWASKMKIDIASIRCMTRPYPSQHHFWPLDNRLLDQFSGLVWSKRSQNLKLTNIKRDNFQYFLIKWGSEIFEYIRSCWAIIYISETFIVGLYILRLHCTSLHVQNIYTTLN